MRRTIQRAKVVSQRPEDRVLRDGPEREHPPDTSGMSV